MSIYIFISSPNANSYVFKLLSNYTCSLYCTKESFIDYTLISLDIDDAISTRVGVKYSTCTWYLYLSTYLSVLAVLEYLVYGNVKVLVLVLVLDQNVLGTYK